MNEKNYFNRFFHFTKDQQKGLVILLAIILLLQIWIFCFHSFSSSQSIPNDTKWLAYQTTVDSLKENLPTESYKLYPFNPNFITDFKGYKLGMKPEEIDRLLAFRKENKFVNSPEEFQKVTGVSDSLLRVISPYFKFPDWVKNKKQYPKFENNYPDYTKKTSKPEVVKVIDLNSATQEDLMKVYGIGEVLSSKILEKREKLGAFVAMEQLEEIWGLQPETIDKLNKSFKIENTATIKKIAINDATIKELAVFPYFNYKLAKNIVSYRSMNGPINFGDLSNIKDFPVEKIKIIALYLEF